MKNKFAKSVLGAIFALSLAFSVGAFVNAKPANAVSAYEISYSLDETSEEPVESSEKDEEEKPAETSSEAPAATEESSSGESSSQEAKEDKPASPGMPSFKEIFDALKNTLKDALKDLIAHLKRWFRFE